MGAKISSVHSAMSRVTPVTTVGRWNSPSAVAALHHGRARLDRLRQESAGPLALLGADHRAEADLVPGRVADGDPGRPRGQVGDIGVVDRPEHDVPSGGDAGLALVVEGGPGADLPGLVQVGVLQHDQRVVAAEFEGDAA